MAPSSAERPVASGSAASRLRPGRGGRRPRRRVAALGLAAAAAARPLAASALAPAQRAPCPSSPGRPPHPPAACEWRPRLRLRRPRPPRRPRRPLAAPAQARARRAVKSAQPPLQPPRPLHPRRRPRGAVARRRSFWSIAACVANVCGLSGNLDCCPACIRPVVPAWVPPHPPQRIIRGMAAQRATALWWIVQCASSSATPKTSWRIILCVIVAARLLLIHRMLTSAALAAKIMPQPLAIVWSALSHCVRPVWKPTSG